MRNVHILFFRDGSVLCAENPDPQLFVRSVSLVVLPSGDIITLKKLLDTFVLQGRITNGQAKECFKKFVALSE